MTSTMSSSIDEETTKTYHRLLLPGMYGPELVEDMHYTVQ
jgi:hypothetical protein